MSANAASFISTARALAAVALLSATASTAIAADAASLPAPVAQPAPPLAEAQAPAFAVGEAWTFSYENALEPAKNATYAQSVSSVAADGSPTLNGGAAALDASGNLVKNASGSYQPSDGKLQFPLFVGKSWSASYVYRAGSWAARGEREAKVVAVERVETSAGAFDAFKVEQVVSWSGTEGNRGQGVTRETDWYAPSVGRIVRMEYVDQAAHAASTTTRVELAKFSAPQ
ncbi:TapB family protein [Trinickia acidisoli]|uniref:TapB family protein n=1 Tax=Trinickia acidisoli TaxID=2767482 RepID=UPI001A90BF30|nr:hypothetical protein [Trinickia acidisoli]